MHSRSSSSVIAKTIARKTTLVDCYEDEQDKVRTKGRATCEKISLGAFHFFSNWLLAPLYPVSKLEFAAECFMPGDAYWGKAADLFSEEGSGLNDLVVSAIEHAKQTSQGIAAWRLGPKKTVILVTQPADIQSIIKDKASHIYFHDTSGSFKLFFGDKTIFNAEYNSDHWKHLRIKFKNMMMTESALKNDMEPMKDIINYYVGRIVRENGEIQDLEAYANFITMDIIGKLKLGFSSIDEKIKRRMSSVIEKAAIQVANPVNQLINEYLPWVKYFYQSKLDEYLKEGFDILRNEVVKPNQESILGSNNWLNDVNDPVKMDLQSQETIYEITQFLVAGHETTAKLLLMTLLLLGDSAHRGVLEKLQIEIAQLGVLPQDITFEQLNQLPYLHAVIQEVLRLYPPIPDMMFKVAKDFSTELGTFRAGDFMIISPRATQRNEKVWGADAMCFKPERMLDNPVSSYAFFPFGFAPRPCVGQRISLQEVKLIVSRLVHEFNLKHTYHHPFPHHQVFTLRIDMSDIKMQFESRNRPGYQSTESVQQPVYEGHIPKLQSEAERRPSFRL